MDSRYLEYPLQKRDASGCDGDDYNDIHSPAIFKRKPPARTSSMEPLQPRRSSPVLTKPPLSNFHPDDPALIKEGQTVEHERFGRGKIKSVEGVLPNAKAVVVFNDGPRTLLLKFARLRMVK
jgi:DNA helicase-2/ATP-dependent DNA helicase PcrA